MICLIKYISREKKKKKRSIRNAHVHTYMHMCFSSKCVLHSRGVYKKKKEKKTDEYLSVFQEIASRTLICVARRRYVISTWPEVIKKNIQLYITYMREKIVVYTWKQKKKKKQILFLVHFRIIFIDFPTEL